MCSYATSAEDDDLSENDSNLFQHDELENNRSDSDNCSGNYNSQSTLKFQPQWNMEHVYEFGEFGEFENSHSWVQCQSKTYSDRPYYHNMHSNCNTWCRPVSYWVNIPRVSTEKMNYTDDPMTNNLDLMMVSDNENERNALAVTRDGNGSSIEMQQDIIERCYYTPRIDPTFDTENNFSGLSDSSASEYCNRGEQHKNNSDACNDSNETQEEEEEHSPFDVADFLETEFRVGDEEVVTKWSPRKIQPLWDDATSNSSASPPPDIAPERVIYGIPRLKKISLKHQLVKWKGTRVLKHKGPRKIICEINGIRTVNYDLPAPDEVRPEAGVKSTKLSESESDSADSVLSSPSRRNAKMRLYDSDWGNLVKNLRQPLLSDSSSSPSSRSGRLNRSRSRSCNSKASSSSCSCSSSCSSSSSSSSPRSNSSLSSSPIFSPKPNSNLTNDKL